jgi:type II secretory pathway pseudopilin PulG
MLIGKRQLLNASIHQSGYILVGLLILIIVAGYTLAAAGTKFSEARKREREQELLKIGDTIRKAIGNYYNQTPGVVKQYPPNLEALLLDNRLPEPKRYLRKLYIDPITQREGWGTVVAPSGGVMGVYSLSAEKPYKSGRFKSVDQQFENKKYYAEWYFIYVPPDIAK